MNIAAAKKTAAVKRGKGRPKLPEFAPLRISAKEFSHWQDVLGLSNADIGRRIGASPNSIRTYRAEGGGHAVAFALRALVSGVDAADSFDHCAKIGAINKALRSTSN